MTIGSLSFAFPGTANGRFKLSSQNFRYKTFSFHIFFLVSKELSCISVLKQQVHLLFIT